MRYESAVRKKKNSKISVVNATRLDDDEIIELASDAIIERRDIDPGKGIRMVFDDELSKTYSLMGAPQTVPDMCKWLRRYFALPEEIEEDLEGLVSDLVECGLDIPNEYQALASHIDKCIVNNKWSAAMNEIDNAQEKAKQVQIDSDIPDKPETKLPEAGDLGWKQTATIGAIGLLFATIFGKKANKQTAHKQVEKIQTIQADRG